MLTNTKYMSIYVTSLFVYTCLHADLFTCLHVYLFTCLHRHGPGVGVRYCLYVNSIFISVQQPSLRVFIYLIATQPTCVRQYS